MTFYGQSVVRKYDLEQRWKKMVAAAAPCVLIFNSCATFWFFSCVLLIVLPFFCNFGHFC